MYSSENLVYVLTILENIEKSFLYTEDINSADDFFEANEQLNFNACQLLLMTIGEESKKISEDVKIDFQQIDWTNIANFRNRIAHDYRGINPEISFGIITKFLPKLKSDFIEILMKTDFEKEVLQIALNSKYYKHIQYLEKIFI